MGAEAGTEAEGIREDGAFANSLPLFQETIAKLERQRQQASRMEPELEQAQRQLHDIAARLEKYRSEGRLHQREVQERLARRLTEIRDWTLQADRQKRREKHKSAQVTSAPRIPE